MAFDTPMPSMGMDLATSQAGTALGGLSIPNIQTPRVNMNPMQRLMGLRAMGYLHRLNGGFSRGGYNSGRGMPGSMSPNDMTGVDPSTMDMGKVNALLGQFGEQMPQNPSPYAILPNSGFFGQHQRLGGALEGALFGAANTGPADTWGEGISSVARGLIGGTAERARAVNQQFSQPIQTAQQMGQLMQLQQRMQLEGEHEKLYQAQAEKDLRAPTVKQPYSGMHIGQDGKLYGVRNDDPEGRVRMLPGQDENASLLKPSASAQKLYGGMPASITKYLGQMIDPATKQPLDPTKLPSPAMVAQANKMALHDAMARAAVAPAMSTEAAAARQDVSDAHKAIDESWRAMRIPLKAKPSELDVFTEEAASMGFSDPSDPKFITMHNRNVDKQFQRGDFAPGSASNPMPTAKKSAPAQSPKGNWNAITGKYE